MDHYEKVFQKQHNHYQCFCFVAYSFSGSFLGYYLSVKSHNKSFLGFRPRMHVISYIFMQNQPKIEL